MLILVRSTSVTLPRTGEHAGALHTPDEVWVAGTRDQNPVRFLSDNAVNWTNSCPNSVEFTKLSQDLLALRTRLSSGQGWRTHTSGSLIPMLPLALSTLASCFQLHCFSIF